MSVEKSRAEAARWLSQARADLRAAQASRTARSFEWACFQCQQAGEKALKALWMHDGHEPWGHSLTRLVEEYPEPLRGAGVRALIDEARLLDKLYIPTRYPNGLPDLTPAEVYGEPDAAAALAAAQMLLNVVTAIAAD
jgi:HEPN domain-containing protein